MQLYVNSRACMQLNKIYLFCISMRICLFDSFGSAWIYASMISPTMLARFLLFCFLLIAV
jgi:hypothetical protein